MKLPPGDYLATLINVKPILGTPDLTLILGVVDETGVTRLTHMIEAYPLEFPDLFPASWFHS